MMCRICLLMLIYSSMLFAACSSTVTRQGVVGYRPDDPQRGEDGRIARRSRHENQKRAEYFNSVQHKNYIKNF